MFVMKTLKYSIILSSLFLLLVCPANSKESDLAPVALYGNKLFTDQQKRFLVWDKIYSVISLNVNNPGKHILTTHWHSPLNAVEHQTIYRFTSTQAGQVFQLYLWLQLWKNGPFERTFTGQDYKQEFHGPWTIRFYLDGQLAGKSNFDID